MGSRQALMGRGLFITGTDTGVGKTVATACLGILLQERGLKVGVMKPVQCGGHDAAWLKKILRLDDPLSLINPCFAPEPLSPHLAFSRQKNNIHIANVRKCYRQISGGRDITLVEGAGGLMVPLKPDYLVADLIREMDLEVIIVARLGLGTINHTLLTVRQARDYGLRVRGIIFSESIKRTRGLPEKTNPAAIAEFAKVPVLGIIPYMQVVNRNVVRKVCKDRINIPGVRQDQSGSNPRARKLADWDKQYLWHPFTQMQDWLAGEPLVIDEAQGSYLKDTRGKQYLDGVSSLWVNVHGHRHPRIDRAIKAQVNRLSHSTLLGLSSTPAVQLAKKLVAIAPRGLKKVFYSDNGSTAVEIAVKMAYQFWQNTGRARKKHIVHLANSYHGDTLGSVSIGGIDLFHKVYRGLTFKTIQLDFPDGYRAPQGKAYPDYAFESVAKLETLLKARHNTIAALVVEPIVQGAAGMIVWPRGVLKKMSALCKKYDVLLIADEVATGFGRTGKMFACEHENVVPDILCLAKGLTGGYLPLAATLTTQRIFDGFCFDYKAQKTFFHGHTYTGNPLSCAAALANLEVFEKERVLARLRPKIKYLSERLRLFYNLPHVGDVRQKGFMAGIELVKDQRTKEPYPWAERVGARVCEEAKNKGVILRPLGNVIVLMPPLSIQKSELKELLEATYWAIGRVSGQG